MSVQQANSETPLMKESAERSPSTLDSDTPVVEQPRPFEIVVRHKMEPNYDTDDDDDEEFFDASDESELPECNNLNSWVAYEDEEVSRLEIPLVDGSLVDSGTNYHYRRRILREHHDSNKLQETTQIADDDDDFELEIEEDISTYCLPGLDSAKEIIVKKFWAASHKVTHFYSLPEWLQDNDFLHSSHRPPMPSFGACFKSIFALHTETGNIWTHVLGCVAFIGVAAWFLTRPYTEIQHQEKIVFGVFFACAIACLGLSSAFHTLSCHSINVGKLFLKLDYVGIAVLIIGSFIPWLFYGFYCRTEPKIVYMALITILGTACIIVSLWDKFSTPRFRPLRAGMFMAMALSGVIPTIHYLITDGIRNMIEVAAFHWLLLMAILYMIGAGLYAARIPERFFPGKCDIWFQSHQIFHLMVIAAAFVHYHGISEMAVNRLSAGSCDGKQSS